MKYLKKKKALTIPFFVFCLFVCLFIYLFDFFEGEGGGGGGRGWGRGDFVCMLIPSSAEVYPN